ncbi:MAG: hypothetical protein KC433_02940, partial [Anaerolineales bacterium]|nr:hypothetical protein [Anaerolineales bacterium]
MTSGLFRGVMKLKTLCVAGAFSQQHDDHPLPSFPTNVLVHTHIFKFYVESAFDKALDVVNLNRDIDLIFIDADKDSLPEI